MSVGKDLALRLREDLDWIETLENRVDVSDDEALKELFSLYYNHDVGSLHDQIVMSYSAHLTDLAIKMSVEKHRTEDIIPWDTPIARVSLSDYTFKDYWPSEFNILADRIKRIAYEAVSEAISSLYMKDFANLLNMRLHFSHEGTTVKTEIALFAKDIFEPDAERVFSRNLQDVEDNLDIKLKQKVVWPQEEIWLSVG